MVSIILISHTVWLTVTAVHTESYHISSHVQCCQDGVTCTELPAGGIREPHYVSFSHLGQSVHSEPPLFIHQWWWWWQQSGLLHYLLLKFSETRNNIRCQRVYFHYHASMRRLLTCSSCSKSKVLWSCDRLYNNHKINKRWRLSC